MDGSRFDDLARSLASSITRRRLFRSLLAGVASSTVALIGRDASAKPTPVPRPSPPCIKPRRQCSAIRGRRACCSGVCCDGTCCGDGQVCVGDRCCPQLRACGDLCCPPENVGCAEINGPDGPTISCLCPEGQLYLRDENRCGCPETCDLDDQCCSGKCCQGVCCAPGQDRCCGGVCASLETCVCPPGSLCNGEEATCVGFGHVQTSGGVCCNYPQAVYCCTDSYPGVYDGSAGCCTLGVDCPEDGGCVIDFYYQSYSLHCCDPIDAYPDCGPDGDCCFGDSPQDGGQTVTLECVLPGDPCHDEWRCCSGLCSNGTCACAPAGNDCVGFACCSGECDINLQKCI